MPATYHEDLADYAPEVIEDGRTADDEALDTFCEETLDTIPALAECDFCDGDCLAPHGPVVTDVPDAYAVHRHGVWLYACECCIEDAKEEGWSTC